MHDPVALVTIPTISSTPVPLVTGIDDKQSLALSSLSGVAVIAMGFIAAGLPIVSIALLAVAAVSSFALGSALGRTDAMHGAGHRVAPEQVASIELRAVYREILCGLAEVEAALADAPRLGGSMAPAIERCRAVVRQAGRIAVLDNPLHRYLGAHDATAIRAGLDRLRARSRATGDGAATEAWRQAIAAGLRQLATLDQLAAKRDQISARLELVRAALASFAGAIVRIHALGEEHAVLAGASVADRIGEIGDDLEELESALAAA